MVSSAARTLRRNATDAERCLWSRLRRRQLDGFKFRRQVPLGSFVLDFACFSARLVIEVDGGQHGWDGSRDEARTAWLAASGFRVVRFWNNEVLANTEGVLERIREVLQGPLPDPPPQGGREASAPPLAHQGARSSDGEATASVAEGLPPPSAGEGWGGGAG